MCRTVSWFRSSGLLRLVLGTCIGIAMGPAVVAEDGAAPVLLEPRPLHRIPPGTPVFAEQNRGYSDLLLFVKGRLAAGDVGSVSETMRYYTDLFNLVFLADVKRGADGRHRLADVAVGFATKIRGQDVAVTADSAERLGASLSIVGSTVLAGNEAALQEITLTAQNGGCAVIDAPTVVLFMNRHQKMVVRYFVWVSGADGRVGMAAWLLRIAGERREFVEKTLQYLPPGMVEDRVMHVDASRFLLGMPTADAFAVVAIPQGRPFAVTPRLEAVGARRTFDEASLAELVASLAEALSARESP